MLAALSERVVTTRDRIVGLTAPVAEPTLAFAQQAWSLLFPYAVKAFHWGFIPCVLALGVISSNPRPKLIDLLTPM